MKLVAEHRLRNNPAETRQVQAWLQDFAARACLSEATRQAFDLSLEEWLTNVINYGYEDAGEHWIQLRFFAAPADARVEVEDDGRAFNPLELPPVDTTTPLEQRSIGGLGIHMIRKLMDSLEYRRHDGRNCLVLTRRRG